MNHIFKILLTFALLTGIAGCDKAPKARPLVEVVINEVAEHPYKESSSFVGRLTAGSDIEIASRVKATIESINFDEGKNIDVDSILYTLNDDELQAKYKQAKAEVSKIESSLEIAQKNYKRGQNLSEDGYISSSEIDELSGKVDELLSSLQSVKAQLETAEVNLAYTTILAPISGTVGRSEYSVGDLVSPESGALTTIVAVNMMEVPFQLSENVYWTFVRKYQTGKLKITNQKPIVRIALNNELYPEVGIISFIGNRVDPETGTMELRATIPNPNKLLKPGQYVKIFIEAPEDVSKVMVEQSAVQSDQQGDFVMTVTSENIIKRQNVKLSHRVDTKVIVEEGLDVGETIVINGVQRIRNGQQVTTKSVDAPLLDTQK